MSTSVETAKDLMTFAAGPSALGVGTLVVFARGVLNSDERSPRKGWLAVGAGAALVVWLLVFVSLAAGPVVDSRRDLGEPTLILLAATWLVAIGLLVVVLGHTRRVARYLVESYRADELPPLLSPLERWLRR
jgi:hypothetical protein